MSTKGAIQRPHLNAVLADPKIMVHVTSVYDSDEATLNEFIAIAGERLETELAGRADTYNPDMQLLAIAARSTVLVGFSDYLKEKANAKAKPETTTPEVKAEKVEETATQGAVHRPRLDAILAQSHSEIMLVVTRIYKSDEATLNEFLAFAGDRLEAELAAEARPDADAHYQEHPEDKIRDDGFAAAKVLTVFDIYLKEKSKVQMAAKVDAFVNSIFSTVTSVVRSPVTLASYALSYLPGFSAASNANAVASGPAVVSAAASSNAVASGPSTVGSAVPAAAKRKLDADNAATNDKDVTKSAVKKAKQ